MSNWDYFHAHTLNYQDNESFTPHIGSEYEDDYHGLGLTYQVYGSDNYTILTRHLRDDYEIGVGIGINFPDTVYVQDIVSYPDVVGVWVERYQINLTDGSSDQLQLTTRGEKGHLVMSPFGEDTEAAYEDDIDYSIELLGDITEIRRGGFNADYHFRVELTVGNDFFVDSSNTGSSWTSSWNAEDFGWDEGTVLPYKLGIYNNDDGTWLVSVEGTTTIVDQPEQTNLISASPTSHFTTEIGQTITATLQTDRDLLHNEELVIGRGNIWFIENSGDYHSLEFSNETFDLGIGTYLFYLGLKRDGSWVTGDSHFVEWTITEPWDNCESKGLERYDIETYEGEFSDLRVEIWYIGNGVIDFFVKSRLKGQSWGDTVLFAGQSENTTYTKDDASLFIFDNLEEWRLTFDGLNIGGDVAYMTACHKRVSPEEVSIISKTPDEDITHPITQYFDVDMTISRNLNPYETMYIGIENEFGIVSSSSGNSISDSFIPENSLDTGYYIFYFGVYHDEFGEWLHRETVDVQFIIPLPIFYLKPTGNDNNGGYNWGDAWATLRHSFNAIPDILGNDETGELYIAYGTYNNQGTDPIELELNNGQKIEIMLVDEGTTSSISGSKAEFIFE